MRTEPLVIQTDSDHNSNKLATHVQSIALLLDSAPRTWTSQEDIHLRLCRALTAQGIRPVLVYASQLPPELERRLRAGGAEIEIASYGHGRYRYYRALGRIIKRYSITLVHICFFDYFSLLPWLARLQGVRRIIFEELNSGLLRATSWKRKLLQLRTLLVALPMTRVVAISHFVKQDLVRRGIAPDRIVVRHLGVDTERFAPDPNARARWAAEYPLDPDELFLSTVAVLRPFKQPQTIVEACGLLAQRGIRARLFVAGDGALLADLKALSQRLRIADRTHWLGYCADPTSLLQASDVFVLASIGEAFGLVTAEAMACGVPVVGSRSGATVEIVADGRTGILATPQDPASFADALERLARDEQLRREMGRLSLARVRENFTVELDVANTLRIYESLWRDEQ
ncbi:MAG: glycosyltransferase family 4 protein [Pyrinomonadaceae bacterium]